MAIAENEAINFVDKSEKFKDKIKGLIPDDADRKEFMYNFAQKAIDYKRTPTEKNFRSLIDLMRENNVPKEVFEIAKNEFDLPDRLRMAPRPPRRHVKQEKLFDKERELNTLKGDLEGFKKIILSRAGRAMDAYDRNARRYDRSTFGKVMAFAGITAVTAADICISVGLKTAYNIARSGSKFVVRSAKNGYKAAKGTAEKHQEQNYQRKMELSEKILDALDEKMVAEIQEASQEIEGVNIPSQIKEKLDIIRAGDFTNVENFEKGLDAGKEKQAANMQDGLKQVREGEVREELKKAGFSQEAIDGFLSKAKVGQEGELQFPQPDLYELQAGKLPEYTKITEFLQEKDESGNKKNAELASKLTQTLSTPRVESLTREQLARLSESIEIQENDAGEKQFTFRGDFSDDPQLQAFIEAMEGKNVNTPEMEKTVENLGRSSNNFQILQAVSNEVVARHGQSMVQGIREDLKQIDHMKEGYDQKETEQGELSQTDQNRRMALRRIAERKVDMVVKKGLVRVVDDDLGQQRAVVEKGAQVLTPGLEKVDEKGSRKLEEIAQNYDGPEIDD